MIKKINAKAMIDVIGNKILEDVSIIIRDDIITWVGPNKDCSSDLLINVQYDLKDQYILPGLINSHLHLAIKPKPIDNKDFFNSFSSDPPELLAIYATQNAKKELLSGVTTVRDCGAAGNIIECLRTATKKTSLSCPRIVHCGPIITVTGGHGHTMGAEADGPDTLRKLVRNLSKKGVDFIKIAVTGGGTPGTKSHLSYFNNFELNTIVNTAHSLELKVSAHARGVPGCKNAIAACVDSIEHCDFECPNGRLTVLNEELDVMAEKSIFMVPTIQLYFDLLEKGKSEKKHRDYIDSLKSSTDQKLKTLEASVRAGVNIAAGNDAGLPDTTFGELWKELSVMSQGGMNNMHVIQSATLAAAKLLSIEGKTGSISCEKIADIIAVKNNPLENINTLENVCFVMKGGVVYKNMCQ